MGLGQDTKLYGLPILWNIVQDSFHSGAEIKSSDVLRVALEAIQEILARPLAPRMYYLLKSINNLRQGVSLYPSACIVVSIVEVIDSQSVGTDEQDFNPTGQQAIQCVDDCLGFVDLIIASITVYDNQVKEALKVITRKNKAPIDQVEEHVFYGRTSHHETQSKLLGLLEFVVLNSNHAVTI